MVERCVVRRSGVSVLLWALALVWCAVVCPLARAEVWEFVDRNGVVHMGNHPRRRVGCSGWKGWEA